MFTVITSLYFIVLTHIKDQVSRRNLPSPAMCEKFINHILIVLLGPVLTGPILTGPVLLTYSFIRHHQQCYCDFPIFGPVIILSLLEGSILYDLTRYPSGYKPICSINKHPIVTYKLTIFPPSLFRLFYIVLVP